MSKKLLSALLALVMVLSLLPVNVFAAAEQTDIIKSVGFAYRHPSITPQDAVDKNETARWEAFDKLRNVFVVWFKAPVTDKGKYSFEIKAQDDAQYTTVTDVNYTGTQPTITGSTGAYFEAPANVLNAGKTTYTVKVTETETKNYQEKSIELLKVTLKKDENSNLEGANFVDGESKVQKNGDAYSVFVEKNDTFVYLPNLKDGVDGGGQAGEQFVGWAKTSGSNSADAFSQTPLEGSTTYYAVFGVKPVSGFVLMDKAPSGETGGSFPESNITGFTTTAVYGATESKPINIYIVNKGNQDLGNETSNKGFYVVSKTTDHFNLEFDISDGVSNKVTKFSNADKYIINAGENANKIPTVANASYLVLKCTPKANINAGTYTDKLVINTPDRLITQVTLTVKVTKPTVTVNMGTLAKFYGETVTLDSEGKLHRSSGEDVPAAPTITINGKSENAPSFASLGLNLINSGMSKVANVNAGDGYKYEVVSSNGNYDITVNGTIKVNKTEPEGKAGVKASAVKVGEPLNGSVLTGDFVNPHTGDSVPGTLKWTNDNMGSAPGTAQKEERGWTFTPQDTANYETVTGTADIEVVEEDPVTITPNLNDHPNEVTYDGNPHQLAFIVTDAEQKGVPGATLTFQYKAHEGAADHDGAPQTGEWKTITNVNDWPKDAGTWDIKAAYAGTSTYAPAEAIFHLIIKPVTVELFLRENITRPYDGTRTVKTIDIGVRGALLLKGESLKVDGFTAEFDDPNVGTNKTVTITDIVLAANDTNKTTNPNNYKVSDDGAWHTTGSITPVAVTLTPKENADFSKYYGETYTFEKGRFDVKDVIGGEDISNVNVEFSSAGAGAEANAGTSYDIIATVNGGNYTLKSDKVGELKVIAVNLSEANRDDVLQLPPTTTPVYVGTPKSNVKINAGVVVNPYNKEMVVNGNWELTDKGDEPFGTAGLQTLHWQFTTEGSNYTGTLTGEVAVTVMEEQPVKITIEENLLNVTYNGQVQMIDEAEIKTDPQSAISVSYDQPAAYAGTYQLVVTAAPSAEGYGETQETFNLVINPAEVKFTPSADFSAKEGEKLPGVNPVEHFFGVNNEGLNGTFTWDDPNATVTQESASFGWRFVPEDTVNYISPVTGTFTVTMAADTREVKATVYNLPENDYAVVTIGSGDTGLKAGEKVTFYKDEACTDPVSRDAEVPASGEKFTVPLDSDALDKEKGTIYAKIGGQKTATAAISYLPELGFTLPFEMVLLHVGGTNANTSETVKVTPTDSTYTIQSDEWIVTGDGANLVKIEDHNNGGSATFTAITAGTAPITVSITFNHPDTENHSGETITVTKNLPLNITTHYVVFIEKVENGSATATPTEVDAGKTVTVTLTAVSGYHGSGLKVYQTGADGNKDTTKSVTTSGSGSSYTFTMPESDVVLVPAFEKNTSTGGGGGSTGGGGSFGGGGFGGGGFGGGTFVPPAPEAPTLKPEVSADASGEAKAPVASEEVESAVEEARQNGAGEIVIEPQVTGSASKVSVELEKESVGAVAKESADLTVKTGAASVTLPDDSLAALAAGTGSSVTVSVEAKTGGAVDIEVAVDGKAVESLSGGMKVELPKASGGNVLVIVGPDGKETVVKKSVVSGGSAYALLDGSCSVKVVNNAKNFADVAKTDWYSGAVDFAGSHELFNGVGENNFAPNTAMTRGMFATVLWRFESGEAVDTKSAFADVAEGNWYSDGVAWASEHKIINGYDPNRFAPEDNVTREQLATMLYRYAVDIGLDVSAGGSLSKFSDAGSVSAYAKEALEWAVGAGLIQGNTASTINPAGGAKRAEVATIFMRFCEMITK